MLFSSLFSLIFSILMSLFHHRHKMELKRIRTAANSLSQTYLSKYFSTKTQKNQFNKNFIKHPLITPHYIDESFFQKYKFFEAFNQVGLRRFICNKPKKVELHKMKFFLTIEEFEIICNLSFFWHLIHL